MKGRIVRYVVLWLCLLVFMTVARLVFFIVEPAYTGAEAGYLPGALWHGLPGDLTMSGYLMIIPALWLVASVWVRRRWMGRITAIYFGIVAGLLSLTYVLDAVLYPYWGFRLDATPFFYFFTSPGSAMASLAWWAEALIVVLIGALGVGLYFALSRIWNIVKLRDIAGRRPRTVATVVLSLLAAALFVPIRGGFTVATMTPGRGFFTNEIRINQLTVNPMFSLLYSVTHWDDLGGQFRNFDDARAHELYNDLIVSTTGTTTTAVDVTLNTPHPDVYIIILESFSTQLMVSMGGEDIAPGLDSIAGEGILFTQFYAESFRTDRALPTVLSGYPGQPTTSAIRYTNKLANLPSIARQLRRAGYSTRYYYGGDADFTNMKAYLLAGDYESVVSEEDFGDTQRSSKWGVHDGPLFDRALDDLKTTRDSSPRLTVIQTSSSHEPFDVPFDRLEDEAANAFAYTDDCLTRFINGMHTDGLWDNALIVIVPDHWGCYPKLTDYTDRHHIPLIITGGAVTGAPQRIATIGSQSDIAPTLMGLLGLDSSEFVFGKNILDPRAPHFAWISEPDWYGIITPRGTTTVAADGGMTLTGNEADADRARAFVQLLYDDLNAR